MTQTLTRAGAAPWYRHRWPWLLIAGPAIVVVAGFTTLGLALRSDDGVVADDYYKRGLLINRRIEQTARAAGIEAQASLAADGRIEVALTGMPSPAPDALQLRFAHATRAGLDRTLVLARSGPGTYAGRTEPLSSGRWLVTLRSDEWRLPTVEVNAPVTEFRVGAAVQ